MSPELELHKDKNGNIATNPVTGWITGTLAGIAVLLAIQYPQTPEEIANPSKQIQFALMPQQCLELAEKLTTLAKRVLEDQSGNPPH